MSPRTKTTLQRIWSLLLAVLLGAGCTEREPEPTVLTAEFPLHLEEHLDVASIEASALPNDVPAAVEWRFDEPQPDWKVALPLDDSAEPAQLTRTEDALRVSVGEATGVGDENPSGGIYVDLPDWRLEDWAYVSVRARTEGRFGELALRFNLREASDDAEDYWGPFRFLGEAVAVIHDGSVQTYLLRADWTGGEWEGPWRQLGLMFFANEPASIDLLSVSVIPKEASYADATAGVREEIRNRIYRNTVYLHTPGHIEYRVRVPEGGRLDVGLGVLRDDVPVTFRITCGLEGGAPETLLEESYGDKAHWAQRSLDLSHLAGRTVTLGLEAEAEPGSVALWAAPTLTGAGETDEPNVIFYVIDGGAADYMSVYGYNRRTSPNVERLAAEGAVFEHAYSNSSWTKPSTASFMTSLHHSVLGGFRNWSDPVPEQAVTMAQHFHRARYQTGVFLANPNAGTLSGLQRGVDVMREGWEEFAYFGDEPHSESSRYLHEGFWNWREAYPGTPYWVHFQTTDVHEDFPAVKPFGGLFVGPEQEKTWREWDERLREEGGHAVYSEAYEKTGISRVEFFTLHQGLYDETMAHNDYQLGRLVERLERTGEWENTLLIIGADHSTEAAMDDMGLAIQESLPPKWVHAMFRPSISRVPLIFVWPGRIEGGQRFTDPVSMIDVLPTVLDLVGLPQPEVKQGRSLAPLLLGTGHVEPRPVIFDEYWLDSKTGEMQGAIEVVDGRWGASLWLGPPPEDEEARRPVPLLLFDLWEDPYCLESLHEQRPELVEKYTSFLEARWEEHRALAQRFTRPGETPLTPEQLRTLRELGYIQ